MMMHGLANFKKPNQPLRTLSLLRFFFLLNKL